MAQQQRYGALVGVETTWATKEVYLFTQIVHGLLHKILVTHAYLLLTYLHDCNNYVYFSYLLANLHDYFVTYLHKL